MKIGVCTPRELGLCATLACASLSACAAEPEPSALNGGMAQELTISLGDLTRCAAPRFESTVADACAAPYQVAGADVPGTQLLRPDVHYGVSLTTTTGAATFVGSVRFVPPADGEYLLYLGSPGMEVELVDEAGVAASPVCGSHLPTVAPAGYTEGCSFRGAYAFNLRGAHTYGLRFGPSASRYVRVQWVQRRAAPARVGGAAPSCTDADLVGTLASACEGAAVTTPISAAVPGSSSKLLAVGTTYGVRLREGGVGFEGALGFVPPYTADYLVYVGAPGVGVDVSEAGSFSEPVACAQRLDAANTGRIAGVSCPDLKAAFRYRKLEAGIPHQLELGPVSSASWVRTRVVPSAPDSDGDLLADNLDRCPSEANPGTSCGCAASVCEGGALWAKVVDTGGLRDTIDAVTVDPTGLIVTMGTVEEAETVTVLAVRKFDAAGDLLWQRTLSYSDDSAAYDVDTDAQGNIVVAGTYYRNGDFSYDAIVAKLDPSGNLLWTQILPSSAGRQRVALDGDGNVFAAATVETASGSAIHLRKLSPTGQVLFSQLHAAIGRANVGDIAVTAGGAPVVVGATELTSSGPAQAVVATFDATGTLARQYFYETSSGRSRATGVTALADGQLLIAGARGTFPNEVGWLRRTDASGSVLSQSAYGLGRAQAPGLAVDLDGNAVVASTVAQSSGVDGLAVRKFDADGSPVWTQSYASPRSARGGGATFAADGSVIAVGTGSSTPSEGGDNGLLLKYLP